MQAVLGLLEDQAARAVQERIGDLLPAMGGQAVHDHRIGRREGEEPVVDLVALERLQPPLPIAFLPHADPGVGVDDVRILERLGGLGGEPDPPPQLAARLQHAGVRLVAGRGRHHRAAAEHRAQQQEGVAHVVAVAHPGQP